MLKPGPVASAVALTLACGAWTDSAQAQATLETPGAFVLVSERRLEISADDYKNGRARIQVEAVRGRVYQVLTGASRFSPLVEVSHNGETSTHEAEPGQQIRAEVRAEANAAIRISVSSRFDDPLPMRVIVRGFRPMECTATDTKIIKNVQAGGVIRGSLSDAATGMTGAGAKYRFRINVTSPVLVSFDTSTFGHYFLLERKDGSPLGRVPSPLFGRIAYLLPETGATQDCYLKIVADAERSREFAIKLEPVSVANAPREKARSVQPRPSSAGTGHEPRNELADALDGIQALESAAVERTVGCGVGCTRLPDALGPWNGGGRYVVPVAIGARAIPANRSQEIRFMWNGKKDDRLVYFAFGQPPTLHEQGVRFALCGELETIFDYSIIMGFVLSPAGEQTTVRISEVYGDWEKKPFPFD